ncbi:MAG: type II toxin-antitoxin system prevent-host-death family antitoxin [Methylobacteriaceae bacterium]|nr:type II toxin-antitoxin system prevent-host-death family antitoxin [Methylobacteriaceae bacterium]
MSDVTVRDAKNRLTELARRVEAGEAVVVTPRARLAPARLAGLSLGSRHNLAMSRG